MIFIDRKPPDEDFVGDHPRLTEAETFAMFEGSVQEGNEVMSTEVNKLLPISLVGSYAQPDWLSSYCMPL